MYLYDIYIILVTNVLIGLSAKMDSFVFSFLFLEVYLYMLLAMYSVYDVVRK